jgi:shikimate kinase
MAKNRWGAGGVSRVVLTGFMRSGKSTVGRLLARALEWEFLDSDQQIELENGETAGTVFLVLGETRFRQMEAAVIARCLGKQKVVLALGGAAIDLEANRATLAQSQSSLIVFLDGDFDLLIERCLLQERTGQATYRPLLHKKGIALSRFAHRREWNMTHAHLRVDVSNRTCETSAAIILQHFGYAQ